jgi:hypothetical protein
MLLANDSILLSVQNLLGRIQGPLRYGIGTKLQERGVLAVADYITMLAIFCYWLFF